MKRVVLLGINARPVQSTLALYCLREFCRDLPHSFIIMERGIHEKPSVIAGDINSLRPDIIAISSYIWNAALLHDLLPLLGKAFPVILGGPEAGYNPAKWLSRHDNICCIVTGPGEAAFRYLLETGPARENKTLFMPNPPFAEMPFPYRDEDFTTLSGRYIYYESSRGCPYRCTYCISARDDQRLEKRGLERAIEEIDVLIAHMPRMVKFVDRTFNASRPFARAIWKHIADKKPGTQFHFEIHPALLEDEDFTLAGSFPEGLIQFEIGIQSTNTPSLEAVGRKEKWGDVRRAIERILAVKTVHVHVDMIAGLPYDSMDTITRSFNDIYALRAHYFQLGFLKLLPGTEIYARREEYGMSHEADAPYRVTETRWLTPSDISELMVIEGLLNSLYNTGRFKATLPLLEGLYPGPFDLFRILASHWRSQGLNPKARDWMRTARGIASFAAHTHPEACGDITEGLRDDFFAWGRVKDLPDFLK